MGGMAAVDLDGDGSDELLVQVPDGVSIYDGAALEALVPTADPFTLAACTGFDESAAGAPLRAAVIPCAADDVRDVECSASYGEAVAAGDIDADGDLEVLVGDPMARVGGSDRAGAVHVVEVDPASWTVTEAATLSDASPETGQALGSSVAVLGDGTRAEPLVGAPGSGEVFEFLCSGVEGDRPNRDGLDGQCRPR
jgi:hypothetical protein